MVTNLIAGYCPAFVITSLAPLIGLFQNPFRGISILLCPDANHTSPMSILLSTTSSPSDIVIECFVKLASGVSILTIQSPSLSATALSILPFQDVLILTVLPLSDLPHILTLLFCCKTIPSLNISGNCGLLIRAKPIIKNASIRLILFIVVSIICI